MPKTFSLGFSPCPNDRFIFDALVNQKIDTGGLKFEPILEDVETLNQMGLQGKLDISKLSFPAFFQSLDTYVLLNTGSALGKGVGPILVSKPNSKFQIPNSKSLIAIPGINTTANLLLSFAFPDAVNKIPVIFSAIEEVVINGHADLGVIIHENRFTYQDKGLHKVMDLGEYWEDKMQVPIPLGGIAIKRKMDQVTSLRVNALIRQSLEFALGNYPAIPTYVKDNSQAMDEEVMKKHIDLYVNKYSLDLGEEGMRAIRKLFDLYLTMQGKTGPDLSSSKLFIL